MKNLKTVLIVAAIIVSCIGWFLAGYNMATCHEQHANELLEVGFTIHDDAGFEVERFDGGSHFTTTERN